MKEIFTSSTKQGLDDKINEFMENHDVYGWDNVTIVTEKVKDETDTAGYIWKATLTPLHTHEALVTQLCEEHGLVRHLLHEEDIQALLKNMPYRLSPEQMEQVKHSMANTDCNDGLTWYNIENIIKTYGENVEGKKFLLYWGDDDEPVQYEEGDDPDDFDVFYADSLEEAEEQLRAKISEIRNADPGYYGEGWWSRGDDDGIDLDSPVWGTIEQGMTPEQ